MYLFAVGACVRACLWSFANDQRPFVCTKAVQWHDLHFLLKSVKSKMTVSHYVSALYKLFVYGICDILIIRWLWLIARGAFSRLTPLLVFNKVEKK